MNSLLNKSLRLRLFVMIGMILSIVLTTGCSKDEWQPVDVPEIPTPQPDPDPNPDPNPGTDQNKGLSALHVEGRWLCNEAGEHVNLHGFGQTYSPWFNEQGNGWGWAKDPDKCLAYNQNLIKKMLNGGWKVNWLRLHMDPYWSNQEGINTTGENDISAFSMPLFEKYLDEVFVPMVEFANKHSLYVVMRPPGVCPEKIAIGDDYHKYLKDVWAKVVTHKKLKNNPYVMFELANEPINIKTPNGEYNSWSDGAFQNCTEFFQQIVDMIRSKGANNILWVPGLSYQMNYQGYAKYPIKGDNIGYAVHCYPGWYGSDSEAEGGSVEQGVVTNGHGYVEFQAGWDSNVMPAARIAPILITEMDWAPKKYDCSWGKATTGEAGGIGFGANFKYIMDKTGNVSWMLFTGPEHLAKYNDKASSSMTFLTDPEACVRPIYRWYQEYAEGRTQPLSAESIKIGGSDKGLNLSLGASRDVVVYAIQSGKVVHPLTSGVTATSADPSIVRIEDGKIIAVAEGETTLTVEALGLKTSCQVYVNGLFPLKEGVFDPNIWEKGTFDEATRTFTTGQYGFAGWHYNAQDISGYKYIVVKLGAGTDFTCQPSFRLFDKGYWDGAAEYNFDGKSELRIEIAKIKRADGGSFNTHNVNIIGFWTLGFKPVVIDEIYVTEN